MPYEPLHHKYRPQTFAQLVGQEAIATTLSNALRQQRIAPAYLFTGPRGTGKTSSARILAKSLNCSQSDVPTDAPCGVCEICQTIAKGSALDVIEIDAASNTGVDNIRELIERAQFAPVQCRYKVYIIDEVHMLSTAAFNALLKTLEEPPARVVFVLATTDPQRVLPTIISRCQRFDYRRIPLDAMVQHLTAIAQNEGIDVSAEAIELVAQIAQGGLRDAESLLDQLSLLEGQITVEKVWDLVGAVPERDLLVLVQAIAQDDGTAVLDQARHLMNRGREPLIVLQNLASFYRDLLIAKTASDRRDLVTLTQPTWDHLCKFAQSLDIQTILHGQQHLRESEVQVKNTTQPRLWLEITLMGLLPSALMGMQPNGAMSEGVPRPSVQATPPSTRQSNGATSPTVVHRVGTSPNQGVNHSQVTAPTVNAEHQTGATAETRVPSQTDTTNPSAPPSPRTHDEVPSGTDDSVSPDAGIESSSQIESQRVTHATPAFSAAVPSPEPTAPLANNPGYIAFQQEKLDQVWGQVIAAMKPLAQALLREHGCLLAFDGKVARVGISSRPLIGIAQSKQRNIEEAFEKVHGTKIMISLEVGTSPTAAIGSGSTTGTGESSPQTPSVKAQTQAIAAPDASTMPAQSAPTPPPLTQGHGSAPLAPSPPSSGLPDVALPPDSVSAKVPPKEPTSTAPAAPQGWQQEDEVTRAAKSLAQMFNGQIVDLDDEGDLDSSSAEETPPSTAHNHQGNHASNGTTQNRKTNPNSFSSGESAPDPLPEPSDLPLPQKSPADFSVIPNPSPKRPINLDDVPF